MRCLTLAGALRAQGWWCGFAVSPETPAAVPCLRREADGVLPLDDGCDATAIGEWVCGHADLLVVDHYRRDAAFEGACRLWAERIAVIDDLADRPHDADLLLDQTYGRDAADYAEILYEGYAPHGVAILVEAATDNPTRTAANVRNRLANGGGNLGSTGSVSFQFRRMGVFRLDPAGLDAEALELDLIDHGLEEMGDSSGEKGEPQLVIRCGFADFGRLQNALEARGLKALSAESEYIPTTPTELADADAKDVLMLIDVLEQDDDVQRVFSNLA
jgi:YebC/PmpR family DNA-binding regulatory protein